MRLRSGRVPVHRQVTTAVTLLLDLAMQLRNIAATLLPALRQIGQVGDERLTERTRRSAFGKHISLRQLPDRISHQLIVRAISRRLWPCS